VASTSRHSSRQTRLSTMQCSSSSSSSSKPHMHTGRKRASRLRLRLAPPPRPIHPTSQHNRRNRHSRRPTWRRNRKHRLQHTRHRPCSHRPCSRYSCRRVLRVLRLLAPRHRLRAGCAPALGHARHDARRRARPAYAAAGLWHLCQLVCAISASRLPLPGAERVPLTPRLPNC
jgi:hypothetical protein